MGARVGFNAAINCAGQSAVAAVAILTLPRLVKGFGVDGFGVLSLVFVAFGAAGFLDLGLGRATAKFVAGLLALGRGHDIPRIVTLSVAIQGGAGILGGAALFLFRNRIAEHLLGASNHALEMDCAGALGAVGLSLPFVLGSFALRGALEGAQRFDLVNSVKIPLNISTYLVPWIAVRANCGLSATVDALALTRLFGACGFLWLNWRIFPRGWRRFGFESGGSLSLFKFAGWSGVSSVIAPLLVYTERFFIASVVSVSAVSFYSVPYEVINGLSVVPSSLAAAVFPAFSYLHAAHSRNSGDALEQMYLRGSRLLIVMVAPIAILIGTFSPDLLRLWQGPEFAAKSSSVLQILAVGLFTNALVSVPGSFLAGCGRPELIAKLHLAQVPVYGALAYALIAHYGAAGGAIGFSLRVSVETITLYVLCAAVTPAINANIWGIAILPGILPILYFFVGTMAIRYGFHAAMPRVGGELVVCLGYLYVLWRRVFDAADRRAVGSMTACAKGVLACG
jgi:O-antigen/teichoic acid export membrane protein